MLVIIQDTEALQEEATMAVLVIEAAILGKAPTVMTILEAPAAVEVELILEIIQIHMQWEIQRLQVRQSLKNLLLR